MVDQLAFLEWVCLSSNVTKIMFILTANIALKHSPQTNAGFKLRIPLWIAQSSPSKIKEKTQVNRSSQLQLKFY